MSGDQITKLSVEVKKGFDQLGGEFNGKLDRLFNYMEKRFDKVDKRFEKVDRDIADVRGAIAELSAQVRDYHHKMIVLSHQVDKMREAIKQIARETGVKLAVEL